MDKDKPAAAQFDARVQPTASKEGGTRESTSGESPNVVVEENDELPALVISDSEEEEPTAVEAVKEKEQPTSQSKNPDISGITPLDVSVVDVDVNTESVVERNENKSMSEKNSKASSSSVVLVCENIDLTETSEAEESLVSDEGRETSGKSEVNSSIREVKDTASMTAQELLQSLLGLQEESPAFSGKKAGKPTSSRKKEKVQSIECSDLIRLSDGPLEQQPTKEDLDEAVVQQDSGTKSASPAESCVTNPSSLNDASTSVGTTVDGEKKCKDSDNIGDVQDGQQLENSEKTLPSNNARQDTVSAESQNSGELDESTSLLEEMEDPTANEKDLEDDQQDGNSLSSAESASTSVEATAKLPNEDDVETMVTSTNETGDLTAGIDEPPRKRVRSSESAESAEEQSAVRIEVVRSPIVNGNDDSDSCSSIPWEASGDERRKECSSKGESVVPRRSVQSQSSSRRNSSSPSIVGTVKDGSLRASKANAVGFSVESTENATEAGGAGKLKSNSENMRAKSVQFLDVLVIDDDDEDEEDVGNDDKDEVKKVSVNQKQPSRSASLEAAAVGAKRARENDTTDDTKRPKMDNSYKLDCTAAASSVKSNSIELEFMRKFAKPIMKMTRDDLEEFVMQKVCQVLLYESEIVKLQKRVNTVESMMQVFKQRLSDANSQYSNLKLVHDRTVIELKKKYNRFMPPVKVTRTVGLQVNVPSLALHVLHEMSGGAGGGVGVDKIAQPVGGLTVIPIPETPQSNKGEQQASGTAIGDSTPTSNNHHTIVQHMMPTVASMNYAFVHNSTAGNLTIQPTDTSSSQNGTTVEPIPSSSGFSSGSRPVANSNNSSSSSGSSITSSNSIASASTFEIAVSGPSGIRKVNTTATSSKKANSVSSEGNRGTSSGSGTARKKTVHKFTPMRPPLSASEQEQQEQLALQHQERLMQEIQSQQAHIAKLVAISNENRGESSGIKTQAPSSSSHSRQASATPQPSSSPSTSSSPVVNNVRPNRPSSATATASTSAKQPRTVPPVQQQTRSSPAMVESLIDLTEEEEVPNNNVGASAALSVRNSIRSRVSQNGTPPHPQPPTSQPGPHGAAAVAANQMGRLKQLGNKEKNRTGGSNSSGTTFISMNSIASTSGLVRNGHGSGTAPNSVRSVYTKSSQGFKLRLIAPAPQWVHPAPLPQPGRQELKPEWKPPPPPPAIRINNLPTGIVISWSMPDTVDLHATIENYEIYAYQETSAPPSTKSWRLVGDVKALTLPMAVTLTHFQEGQRYHFAVRAIDEYKRFGEYSDACTWSEVVAEQQPEQAATFEENQ